MRWKDGLPANSKDLWWACPRRQCSVVAWPGGTSGPLPHLPLAPALTQNRCYHLDQKSHGVTSVGLPGLSIPSFDMVCAFGCSSVAWRSALGIVMVEWLKSQPLTLESKLGARSCPGCFASDPTPCQCISESRSRWFKCSGPVPTCKTWKKLLASSRLPTCVGTWEGS